MAYSPKAPEWLVGVWTPCSVFLAVDVFAFFGLAERDERDDGVIAVGRGARGRVGEAKNIFFGCRGGDFAFRHFSQGQRKKS